MRILTCCSLLLSSALLCACAAAPARQHFLLQANAPLAWTEAQEIVETLGVGPVQVADYLTRNALTVQRADGSLWLSNREIWAESLPEGIARVLALNLTANQAGRGFLLFPWRSDQRPAVSLRLHVHNLTLADNHLWLTADWSLWRDGKSLVVRHFHQSAPARENAGAISQALSQLLRQLAQEIQPDISSTTLRAASIAPST